MVLGTLGSTLNDELNRLANGGTYRDMDDMVDEALAAKQWANRENISPYSTDTVGVLNEIAGLGLDKKNWLDFNGICNYIAGTSGLPAAAALRQIYPTTDLLTGVASYYTDAATPRYNYPGYIRLDGAFTQSISTPDATALDITGDIDLRAYVAADDWTPTARNILISKATGTQNSYEFNIETDGTLRFYWSADGTTLIVKPSTAAVSFANGAAGWVRVTLDVNNGASGNDVKFFTSTDGTTWTQLGTTVTTAGVTSIFNSTSNVFLGTASNGASNPLTGNLYRAQIFASLDGTDNRLDVDLTTNVTSATYDQFTATTGQLCTINGQNTLTNGGSAGALLPTTVGSSLAADSNDAKFLAHDGTNYVWTPGTVINNNLTIPDSAALDITGDIDIRAYVALDDWTPATAQQILTKDDLTGGLARTQASYNFGVNANGTLSLQWFTAGTTASRIIANSTVAPAIADGAPLWVRATLDVDNGASGNDAKFWTSNNGSTWTQLGSTVTTAGVTSIYAGTTDVRIGQVGTYGSELLTGKTYRAQIYSDITETTKVLDVDTSVITAGSATSFTAVTGQTVTINRSTSGRKTVAVTQPTWLFGTDDYMEVNNRYMAHSTSDENYVYLSGASLNRMTVADNPPLDITGDIDIQVRVALDDWTNGAQQVLVGKLLATTEVSYYLLVNASGALVLGWSANGTTFSSATNGVAIPVTDGSVIWVRATLDVDNGASGKTARFFTSNDGTTWTQLGADVTTAGTTSIYSGTAVLEIGSNNNGTSNLSKGKFFRAIIKNGIDGTTVLDANAAVITLPSQTTFVDSSSNAYTVTINKSGVGTFVSTGNYMYLPGVASNFASTPDAAALDIVGDIDIRVKVALDDWTPTTSQALVTKYDDNSNYSFWSYIGGSGAIVLTWSTDGNGVGPNIKTATSTASVNASDGGTIWVRFTLDVDNGASGYTVTFFTSTDGANWTQLGSAVTAAGVTSIYSGTSRLIVGAGGAGSNFPSRGKFFRAQVLNGIGGTVAFDANFEGSITSLTQASFTESSSNAATVTINRSGSVFRSAGVIDAGYLYPGATNTFSNSTTDFLNFGATQSFTLMAAIRRFGATKSQLFFAKSQPGAGAGWALWEWDGDAKGYLSINDGVNAAQDSTSAVLLNGGIMSLFGVRNTTTDTLLATYSASDLSTVTDTTTGSLSNIQNVRIGGAPSGVFFADMEFIAAAVFRTALTATQIRQISNYFANREVYL